jgi:hypothetical protein
MSYTHTSETGPLSLLPPNGTISLESSKTVKHALALPPGLIIVADVFLPGYFSEVKFPKIIREYIRPSAVNVNLIAC